MCRLSSGSTFQIDGSCGIIRSKLIPCTTGRSTGSACWRSSSKAFGGGVESSSTHRIQSGFSFAAKGVPVTP